MLHSCDVLDCDKSIHMSCMQNYVNKNGLAETPQHAIFCGTKHHYNRLMTKNALPLSNLRWDHDGPGGSGTIPNLMWVILDWWTDKGKYAKYHGEKNNGGKNKNVSYVYLSERIKTLNCKVERAPN